MTVYEALSRGPRKRFKAPTVPACALTVKGVARAQHSRTDRPLAADMAVRFRVGVVLVERSGGQDEVDWEEVLGGHWAEERRAGRRSCEKFMSENLMVEEGWCWGGLGEILSSCQASEGYRGLE